MSSKRELAKQLRAVAGFENPRAELEQYKTTPEIAATLVHTASLQGDISDRLIVDLGCGTGMLALASALRDPAAVVGVDTDETALAIARTNERELEPAPPLSWVHGDVTRSPLCLDGDQSATVLMNPPFGAQAGNRHADRAFLDRASELASVSYSIHNAGSADFVESFAADNGGNVTHAFASELDLPRAYEFHSEEMKPIDVEVFRVEWE